MPAYAVVGGQWGDEGKGKIIDLLAANADVVARYSGGNNAGHTVINDHGTFSLHSVPSGICWANTTNIIGNGMVLNADSFIDEIHKIKAAKLPGKIAISGRTHLIMPYHIALDELQERHRGSGAIGTTGKGIGPAYVDKIARTGIRVGELLDFRSITDRLPPIIEFNNRIITTIYGGQPIDEATVIEKVKYWAENLRPYIGRAEDIVADALRYNRNVIFEGAQGSLLDIDHGTYPFVTSSSSTVGGILTGLGVGPRAFSGIVGVFKAYCTRVGAGPLPTEMDDDAGSELREKAHEFGTTTSRPRRIGWFDGVAGKYSVKVNGLNASIITRLDILDHRESVKVCVAYELDGVTSDRFPLDYSSLDRCVPVYETLPGWSGSTSGITKYAELPENARKYISRIEELLGIETAIVSTGPHRNEAVTLRPLPGIWER